MFGARMGSSWKPRLSIYDSVFSATRGSDGDPNLAARSRLQHLTRTVMKYTTVSAEQQWRPRKYLLGQ